MFTSNFQQLSNPESQSSELELARLGHSSSVASALLALGLFVGLWPSSHNQPNFLFILGMLVFASLARHWIAHGVFKSTDRSFIRKILQFNTALILLSGILWGLLGPLTTLQFGIDSPERRWVLLVLIGVAQFAANAMGTSPLV